METSLKIGFAQIFSCCPNFGGAAAPLAPPARTPMIVLPSCSFPMKPCALFCLRLVSYQLLKRWIILSAGNVSIQEITQLVSLALIHCEVPGEKSFLCGMDFSPHKSLASLVSRERLSKC